MGVCLACSFSLLLGDSFAASEIWNDEGTAYYTTDSNGVDNFVYNCSNFSMGSCDPFTKIQGGYDWFSIIGFGVSFGIVLILLVMRPDFIKKIWYSIPRITFEKDDKK